MRVRKGIEPAAERGPGRPPVAPEERRNRTVRANVTDAERDDIYAAAVATGETVSDYGRRVLLEDAARVLARRQTGDRQ